jgi:hydroxymethylglutaryl-CoA synthase
MAVGILAYGAYLPRLRLSRKAAAEANAWFNPGLAGLSRGERAMANWDEDSVTMALEAGRDCLSCLDPTGLDRPAVGAVHLASTSLPFDDRQNSGIVAAALNLPESVATLDIAGSQRAATSALTAGLQAVRGGAGPLLLLASERRRAKAGSPQELGYGDGAAGLLLGDGAPVATLIARQGESVDFVDHYRGQGRPFDYAWEERWIRDEGHLKLLPRVVAALLEKAAVAPESIARVCLPAALARTGKAIAERCGFAANAVEDGLAERCGDLGTAHPLFALAGALEAAKPGQRILLIGFGQGCEALLFETTPALAALAPRTGVAGALARRREETSYQKFLAFGELTPLDRGMRAELDKATALSALYRHRSMLLGLVGGICGKCGTPQFPKSQVCVAPNCHAFHSQSDHPFAESAGTVMTYTADNLTYSPDPPQHFGMIQFQGGGRMMMDFTDVDPGKVAVGMDMRMVFRVKDYDAVRGFTRYFWKAAPAASGTGAVRPSTSSG